MVQDRRRELTAKSEIAAAASGFALLRRDKP
jgi:hypothetical protein